MKGVFAVVLAGMLACSPSDEQADTTSLGPIDTLKAAPDTGGVTPAVGATSTTSASPPSGTQNKTAATQPTTATKTGTKAATDTGNLGRDRALPIDTKNPRNRLPTVDTTKRPPGK